MSGEHPSEIDSEPALRIALSLFRWFEFGGMQRTFRRIAEALVQRGHQVDLFCARWDGEPVAGTTLHELGVRGAGNHRRNAAFAEDFAAAVRDHDPHLKVGFTKMPGLDLYYAGDPCFRERLLSRPGGALLKLLPRYRAFVAQEEAVFGASHETEVMLIAHAQARIFQEHYQTPSTRMHLLPPGIDRRRLDEGLAASWDRSTHRADLGLPDDARVLLTVGSGFRTKGVDRTLEALSRLTPEERNGVVFVVVGEGRADEYRRKAQSAGIEFLATGPRRDVTAFYRDARVLVHPARVENTGTTLIEAMYCGLPVICSGVCGFADHVQAAGAGIVLRPRFDVDEYADAIRRALSDRNRLAWEQAGRAYTRQKDLYGLIDAAATLIESLAWKKASASSR